MPDLVYEAFDRLQVILEERRYQDHISARHPDIKMDEIREALVSPTRICDHRTRHMRRIYEGPARVDAFGVQEFVIVVVGLTSRGRGRVITAYRETLRYQGAQRWP